MRFALRVGIMLGCCAPAWTQVQSPWRFWSVADGLPESNTSWLETDNRGIAWARHGLPLLTRLDGYSVSEIAGQFGGGRLAIAPDGGVWIFKAGELRHYDGSQWHSFKVPMTGGSPVAATRSDEANPFVPLRDGRILILFADRITEFDTRTGNNSIVVVAAKTRLKRFTSIGQGLAGAAWVAGTKGLGRISEASGQESLQWQDFSAPDGLENLSGPQERTGGEVFAAASRAGKAVLLRFSGKAWTVVYSGHNNFLQAWRGSDGDTWVGDGNQILRLAHGGNELVARTDALGGLMQNSAQAEKGAFWVATR